MIKKTIIVVAVIAVLCYLKVLSFNSDRAKELVNKARAEVSAMVSSK